MIVILNFPMNSLRESLKTQYFQSRFLRPFGFIKCSFIFTAPLGVEAKLNPLAWTWVALTIDQTVDVVVCVIHSPGEFYCHVLKEDGKLTHL